MDRLMVGVSGVRGTVGGTLTPRVACEFGCAFGTMLGAGRTVTLGRDSRTSGPMVRNAVAAGLLAAGVDVVDLGVLSTPAAAYATADLAADGGVIVTASHNPAEYNGIKFLQPDGMGLAPAAAEGLKEAWQGGQYALADHERQGVETACPDGPQRYVRAVLAHCDAEAVARCGFRVAVDSANGAGGPEAARLLEALGCEVVHLNAEPTGRFAHPPEPVAENLVGLCSAVPRENAAVGFAQDADADRLAVVDERGRFIGEEYTLALAAAHALSGRGGTVVTNLGTSRMIDDVAARHGCEVVRTPTGEANVVGAMRREGALFGGEGGGGFIDLRVGPTRSSFSAMAAVLGAMSAGGKAVSELVAEIPSYVMTKTKLPCPAGAAEKVIARAAEAFAGREGAELNDADGLRVDLPGRWVCVRASNTEPILRIIAESPSASETASLVDEVRALAEEALGAS